MHVMFGKTKHRQWDKNIASAGNRTRAARVAGEHSTTEPPMLRSEARKAECRLDFEISAASGKRQNVIPLRGIEPRPYG